MSAYHLWTVGCQVNQADSGKLAAGLRRLGWDPTDRPDDADFIVLNTCAVREHAEERAASKLGALAHLKRRNPALKIAVMGCMVGPKDDLLRKRFPYVDVFARPQAFTDVLSVLDLPPEHEATDLGGEFWPTVFPQSNGHPTAFVPVIEGCDKFCTYCIVPLRRGRERSRPIEEVEREVQAHVDRGVREVTLLGQTVEAYGKDQPPPQHIADPATAHADLFDLMTALHDLPGLHRIRALTSYPPDMTDRILEGMAALPKVCESFSLPVQSGDDSLLTEMRRGYSVVHFRDRIAKVRACMPEVGISTDVIVGFPGESDAQFQNTYDLLADLRFDKVHVAAYSPRPGTFAARHQPDDLPASVKAERLQAVETLQAAVAAQINQRLEGRTLEVLVEQILPVEQIPRVENINGAPINDQAAKTRNDDAAPATTRCTGRTRTNKLVHFDAPCDTPAAGDDTPSVESGALVHVHIDGSGPWSLRGALAPTSTAAPAT